MAKDKDKQQATLFKSVDDKAITFQRAVFIVCNLKRLIKRPKKDDKHGLGAASSGSRKRSGGGGGDPAGNDYQSSLLGVCGAGDDNTPTGAHDLALGGKSRFRDPVRRAFTLPSILCGSFAAVLSPNQHHHQDYEAAAATTRPRTSQAEARHHKQDLEYDFYASQALQEASSTSMSKQPSGKLRLWLADDDEQQQQQQQQSRPMITQSPSGQSLRSGSGSGSGSGKPQPLPAHSARATGRSSQQSSRASSCVGAGSRRASPVSFSAFERHDRHQHEQPVGHSTGAGAGSQLSSLSCLVTPIRRVAAAPSQASTTTSDEPASKFSAHAAHQLPHNRPDCHGNNVDAPPAPTNVSAKYKNNNQSICCPIWCLAMELLDAHQMQPRDQTKHSHLLGPPSSSPYLPALDQLDSWGGPAASYNERLLERNSSNDDQQDEEDQEQQTNASGRLTSDQMARMRLKRFSSSALCLNDGPTCGRGSATSGEQGRTNHTSGGRKKPPNEKTSRKSTASQQQVKGASESPSSAQKTSKKNSLSVTANSLAPIEDPIVQLARQRRPSVTNQGSVNVDQQALFSAVECNQLERAKSILDDGKVNVNSLNGDKLTCLDVAILLRNLDMVRLLQHYNAKESSAYLTSEGRENQLYSLYVEAKRLVEDLSRSIEAIGQPRPIEHLRDSSSGESLEHTGGHVGDFQTRASHQHGFQGESQKAIPPQQLMLATGSLLSSAIFEEKQRQLQYWRRRLDLFMQMRYGFEKLDEPNMPELVVLQVAGESSLGVKIVHSLSQFNELLTSSLGQQQPHEGASSKTSASMAPLARPLSRLVGVAQERRLHCPMGSKCSHWLMDEFAAFKQQSDNFQLLPPADLSLGLPHQAGKRSKLRHQQQQQHSERLAIFNNLLAQQLTILSNQQRQQKHLELVNSARYKMLLASRQHRAEAAKSRQHTAGNANRPHSHKQLLCSHQIESTDSAYDNLAAAAASKRQQQQVSLLAIQPTSSLQFGADHPNASGHGGGGGGSDQQPVLAYRSLAYQLMTSRRYHPTSGGGPMDSEQALAEANEQAQLEALKASPSSAHLANEPATLSLDPQLARDGQLCPIIQPAVVVSDQLAGSLGRHHHSLGASITTKYKVEWSLNAQFDPIESSMIVYNTNSYSLECHIGQLQNGHLYFVRVFSGNHRGFSASSPTTPACLTPSSWRQALPPSGSRSGNAASSRPAGQQESKKKFKYDEEVFRKFTKLILLNKHILDESQVSLLQREQLVDGRARANKLADPQNKSSLINMLLSDATMPLASTTSTRVGDYSTQHSSQQTTSSLQRFSNFNSKSSHLKLDSQIGHCQMVASSPRGSLYPTHTATTAGNQSDSDSLLADQQQQQQQLQQTSLKVRKNLKNFFQSNSAKFNKLNNQNKRGLYLATLIYHSPPQISSCAGSPPATARNSRNKGHQSQLNQNHSDSLKAFELAGNKLVVTNDDRIPVIEILNDLVAPSHLMGDFYWLLKINGTNWIDMKRLRQQLQKSHSSSNLHLRIKMLAAIEQMQLALNLEDIGRLFYKPIQAHDGSIVICTCRQVNSTKQVSNLSIKWSSQHKIIPRHLRKISDTISLSNQQRERQQQQHEQQMRQQQRARNSTASTSHLGGSLVTHPHQQLNKRHSSSSAVVVASNVDCNRSNSGLSQDNLQLAYASAAATPNAIQSCSRSPATGPSQELLSASFSSSSTTTTTTTTTTTSQQQQVALPPTAPNLVASSGTIAQATMALSSSSHPNQQQLEAPTSNSRLLTASNASANGSRSQMASLPVEINRLCDACQQALVQRRCTMASGSSSSSLASSESHSTWSSSQFSLSSLQHSTGGRSCTCSRSNSATQVTTGGAQGPAQPPQANQLAWSSTGQSQLVESAPVSQRNSTHSTRLASGSMNTMMMMMMLSQGQGQSQAAQQSGNSGGSFSLSVSSAAPGSVSSNSSGVPSAPAGVMVGGGGGGGAREPQPRQTQSQQLTDASGPQKSSTYLMLASLSLYDLLLFHLREIIEFDQASTVPLARGLYLGFVQLQTTVESMRLLVPRRRPNMVPCARIRDNAHVSREEWQLLKSFATLPSSFTNANQVGGRNSRPYRASATPTSSCSSGRSSEPAIWRSSASSMMEATRAANEPPPPPQQTLRSDQQDKHSNVYSSGSLGVNLDPNASRGQDRDRAKSVPPGLVTCLPATPTQESESQMSPGSAPTQASACASKQQAKVDSIHLRPTIYSGGSCILDQELGTESERQRETSSNAQKHSDTDPPQSYSSHTTTTSSQPQCSSSSDGTLGLDLQAAAAASDSNLAAVNQAAASPVPASHLPGPQLQPSKSEQVSLLQQSPELTFVRLVGDAARRLLLELKSQLPKTYDDSRQELVSVLASLNDEENNRIYHVELIELSNQVTFILLIPSPENVCPVTSHDKSKILANNPDYMLLPLQIFETIHLCTYEPDLLGKYSRLSTILETDLTVAQHEHRQAFSSNELKSTKSRVSHLQDMVVIADEFWRQLRWIVDVVSFARDKSQFQSSSSSNEHSGSGGSNTSTNQNQSAGGQLATASTAATTTTTSNNCIKLGSIWRYFDQLSVCPSCGPPTGCLPVLIDQHHSSSTSSQRANNKIKPASPLMKTSSNGFAALAASTATSSFSKNAQDNSGQSQRLEIKRTSSAQLQRAGNNTPPQCEKGASQSQERPILPQIQLPSSDLFEVGGEQIESQRQLSSPSSSSAKSDYAKQPFNRRHSQGEETCDRIDDRTRPKGQVRAESCWQVGSCTEGDGDRGGEVEVQEEQEEEEEEEEEAGDQNECFEESILNVEFGQHHQGPGVVVVSDEATGETTPAAGHNDGHEDNPDEEAIYAYHISLRDATKAAAQRQSSRQLINLLIDHQPVQQGAAAAAAAATAEGRGSEEDEAQQLGPTCGGLNLDRRQFERFAAALSAGGGSDEGLTRRHSDDEDAPLLPDGGQDALSDPFAFVQGDFSLGPNDVIAYKFRKTRENMAPGQATGDNLPALHRAAAAQPMSGRFENENNGAMRNGTARSATQATTRLVDKPSRSGRSAGQLKSTNPFLTDSFEL